MWWSVLGAAVVIFEVVVLARWVTGPYFRTVPSGPGSPPTWMKVVLITWQPVGIIVAVTLLYRVLIRPWRRDGRPSTDGLLCLVYLLLFFQDPLSNYFQTWFTYNTYLVNWGSWVNDIPGWMSFSRPGAQVAEPMLWTPFMYCYAFYAITLVGCWFMRKTKARYPRIGDIRLVAMVLVVSMLADLILEGVLFLPLGFYTYIGGHWALFPQAYHKFPANEMFAAGPMFAAFSSIRYFTNDRGETIAERGIDDVRTTTTARKTILRFLALYGVCSLAVFALYNLPSTLMAAHSTRWPVDAQKRSYLMDRICGDGTDRACPGPAIPLSQGTQSIYINPDGHAVLPRGTQVPKPVPFSNHTAGPFNGPLF